MNAAGAGEDRSSLTASGPRRDEVSAVEGRSTMPSKLRRPAAYVGAAALLALAATLLGSRPVMATGDQVQVVFSQKLPNVPGKTLTAVAVDYAPGGKSGPHHHAGVVFA